MSYFVCFRDIFNKKNKWVKLAFTWCEADI